jgi:hypothetical protein
MRLVLYETIVVVHPQLTGPTKTDILVRHSYFGPTRKEDFAWGHDPTPRQGASSLPERTELEGGAVHW